jgi:hypothetical protein
MRFSLPILAALMIAATAMPAEAAKPVKGVVQGTTTAGKGVVKGTAQAGKGVVQGAGTVAKGTGRGLRCIFTLGNRC